MGDIVENGVRAIREAEALYSAKCFRHHTGVWVVWVNGHAIAETESAEQGYAVLAAILLAASS